MKILVTGVAGFIGSYLSKRLLQDGHDVVGLDNINDYYDINLKFARLDGLGIKEADVLDNILIPSDVYSKFKFIKLSIENYDGLLDLFNKEKFDHVYHLAAQAGVRYSIENPSAYVNSNIIGFVNILECCRHCFINHLVYASSSSVYGLNGSTPFKESDSIAHPVSLYAATKKSNELLAHSYSHLYNLPTTGLRFFTVYGPFGRPDMAPIIFSKSILENKSIKVFNNGNMLRDFTYIDDVVECIVRLLGKIPSKDELWDSEKSDPSTSSAPYEIYNIGNSRPIKLLDFILAFERIIGRKVEMDLLPMQQGDVYQTYADTQKINEHIGFTPCTKIEEGVKNTYLWTEQYNMGNTPKF